MKRALLYGAVVLLFVIIFFALRGPHVSDALSRLILPELADATGRSFAVQRITLNILPLFIEMREVRAYDEKGDVTISASRVKGYLDLASIFRKEVTVRRIAIRDFALRSDRAQLDDLLTHLKKYLSEEKKGPVKVTIKSLDIRNAAISITGGDPGGSASGINGEVQLSPSVRCRLTAQSLKLQKSGMRDLESTVSAFFTVEDNDVQIKELTVRSGDSFLKTSGAMDAKNISGQLETELFLLVENAKDILRLERPGQGTISIKGTLRSDGMRSGIGSITADLKVSVECYLETLMEFLKVKEKLQGYMRSKGTVTGRLDALTAQGEAELSRGNLFGLQIDSLRGSIDYRDGVMTFSKGRASLFGGSAIAEASIALPVVNRYDFHATFQDLDSNNVFQFIAWDPHLSKGVVSGEISSSGHAFSPVGSFSYQSRTPGRDVIGKVKTVEGTFAMQDEVITLPRMSLSTDRSSLNGAGTIDLKRKWLTFTAKGRSADVAELTGPYFTAIRGNVTFDGAVSGPLDDLEIAFNVKGRDVRMSAGNLHEPKVFNDADLALGDVDAAIRYRKNLFTAESLVARSGESEYRANGTVNFPKAQNLFELAAPVYDLTISAKRGDLAGISGLFRDIPPVRALLDVQMTMKGKPGSFTFRGDFTGTSLAVGDISIDRLEASATFIRDTFHVKKIRLQKGDAAVVASGSLSLDKEFSIDAEVAKVRLGDIIPNAGEKAAVSLSGVKVKGEGTFDDPALRFSASVETNATNGQSIGKGELEGWIRGRSAELHATLLNGKMTARVACELRDPFPWRAEAEMQQGRYDPLITGFMKDVPEDLLLTLKGGVAASGDKNSFDASARIEKVGINLYGNAFTNRSPIVVRARDRSVVIEPASFSSDITEFTVGGTINVGKRYDFSIEGSSSLAPLRAFSKQIDLLKGKAYYSFTLAGEWEQPAINGAIEVSEGSLGFRSIPYRLTSVNAYIYFDGDKAVIEKAQGRLSGGEVNVVGSASFSGLKLRKFTIESRLKSITASPSRNFWLTFDGNLYLRGNQDSQMLHGEIDVKRANYSERIDLQSMILKGLSEERHRGEITRLEETKLNVRVLAPHVTINNNLARATGRVDILVRGTIADPIPIGKLETKEGIVYFRNSEFKLIRASLDFATPDRIDPYFDIFAETRISTYDVRLTLNGHGDRFNLLLASSPPLSEQDIFNLLTTGRPAEKAGESTLGARTETEQAATVGSLFTEKIEAEVEDRVKTVIGFDRIDITPYVSKTRGTITPRVSVTKRLFGDRLYVTYSTTVETGEIQVWKLEYALNKKVSLIGSRDETGGIGGDVKFRFEFR